MAIIEKSLAKVMKLEAVIVCINYSDFLRVTLPYTKKHFDRIIVVTDSKDQETADVCLENDVKCIRTDVFYQNGKINKALGINEGLPHLDRDGWVVQLDADIWLPDTTKKVLEALPLDESCIYGIDRMMCESRQEWDAFIRTRPVIHDTARFFLNLSYFRIGKRIIIDDCYFPIGFFQMWHPARSGVMSYPNDADANFEKTDTLHVKQFPRKNRILIPEMICVHLASERASMGQNWMGRMSKKFI